MMKCKELPGNRQESLLTFMYNRLFDAHRPQKDTGDKNDRPVDQRELVLLLFQVDLAVVVDEELDGQKSAGKDNRNDFIPAHRSQPGA